LSVLAKWDEVPLDNCGSGELLGGGFSVPSENNTANTISDGSAVGIVTQAGLVNSEGRHPLPSGSPTHFTCELCGGRYVLSKAT
jgi:hypothetical protein